LIHLSKQRTRHNIDINYLSKYLLTIQDNLANIEMLSSEKEAIKHSIDCLLIALKQYKHGRPLPFIKKNIVEVISDE
jgi:hypothetical protein